MKRTKITKKIATGSLRGGLLYAVLLMAWAESPAWGIPAHKFDHQRHIPSGLEGRIAISSGHDHALALLMNGTVKAGRDNAHGKANVPDGLTGVTDLSEERVFMPADNMTGAAAVTVSLSDFCGTVNGGPDQCGDQVFTTMVGAVNDPPSFTKRLDVVNPPLTHDQSRHGQFILMR